MQQACSGRVAKGNGLASAYICCLLVRFEQWHNLSSIWDGIGVAIERTRLEPRSHNHDPNTVLNTT